MNAASALLAVLDKLLWVLLAWRRGAEQEEAQDESDKLSQDPGGWFAGHFDGGMRKQQSNGETSGSGKTKPDDN